MISNKFFCMSINLMVFAIVLLFNPMTSAAEKNTIVFSAHFSKNGPKGKFLNMVYTEAFKRLGMKFVFKEFPTKRSSKMSDAGQVDGELSRVHNYLNAHPNLIRIEEPHYISGILALAVDPSITLDGWESLKNTNYKIDYKRGIWLIEFKLPKYVKSNNLEAVISIESGLKKLIAGRCDVFVEAESDIISVFGKGFKFSHNNLKDSDIRIAGIIEKYSAHAYLHQKHKELAPKLAEELKKMKAEGIFEKFRKATGYETLFKEDGSLKKLPGTDQSEKRDQQK